MFKIKVYRLQIIIVWFLSYVKEIYFDEFKDRICPFVGEMIIDVSMFKNFTEVWMDDVVTVLFNSKRII